MPRIPRHLELEVLLGLLKEVRDNVPQAAVAHAMGWKQTDVSKVERGARRIEALELRAWIHALGWPFEDVMRELDERLMAVEHLQEQAGGRKRL